MKPHKCPFQAKPTRAVVSALPRIPSFTHTEPWVWSVEYDNRMLLMDILYCPWCGENLRMGAQRQGLTAYPPVEPTGGSEVVPDGVLTAQTIGEFKESIAE